ncbi:unnamed protein product [Phytophthora fragariaefolia]|uniref:Unnamed protein product n=1 Tax=Phytophthora fragariaefolia TaxID=1490495 RepID=A0A9W6XT32_9STRA|nr:unnamed protein product [Phytophthora fragariaefolia]
MQFKLRSKTYLQNKIKETTAPPLSFTNNLRPSANGCNNPKLQPLSKKDFVVTLIIPGSPLVATVQYFARTLSASPGAPTEAEKLWERFLNSDDEFRKARLKLVPTIVDGPWVIRKAVGSTPCIIGKAIQTTYFQSPSYLEVHVDISSDTIAKHITSMCRSHSTSFAVNMGFIIEGQSEEQLPEALLGCVQSARQAKRLVKEREAEAHVDGDEESQSEEELEEKRPATAGFAFLVDSDDSEEEQEEEQEEEEEHVEDPVVVAPEPPKGKKK